MRRHLKSWLALIVPSPALIVPLPTNRFTNKLASDVPNNILKTSPFCSFDSFVIVSLMPFIDIPDFSKLFLRYHSLLNYKLLM